MNKVFLSGRLTRDPEVKYTPNGKAYTRVGLAVDRNYQNKNAESDQPTVDFFNLSVWEKTAEFFGRYLSKGRKIVVEGRLQTYTYEKDGVKRSGFDVVVDRCEFADAKPLGDSGNRGDGSYGNRGNNNYGGRNSSGGEDASSDFAGESLDEDNIPF